MFVTSKDGTKIAYDKRGQGPALILVDGAMCYRAFPPTKLPEMLGEHFTVYKYDRRGRGESTNTLPYTNDREVEDIAALLEAAGGEAYIYGISSGAVLAVNAASALKGITKLAAFEAPFIVDDTRVPMPKEFIPGVQAQIDAGKPANAVKMFMKYVGMPSFGIFIMSLTPVFKKLAAVGYTLPYDLALVEPFQKGQPLPRDRWDIQVPALIMAGGKSPAYMINSQVDLADAIGAKYRLIEGQTHMLKDEAIAPILIEFFQ